MPSENTIQTCAARAEILSKVKRIIIDNLNLDLTEDQIDDDSPLFGTGLGLDSIDALDLVIGVEEGFSIKVGEDELHVFKSVNSLVDYIIQRQSADVEQGGVASADWNPEDLDAHEILDPGLREAYRNLRLKSLVSRMPQTILKFPEGDATLEALGGILTGKLLMMEPNKILYTALVDDQGRTVDLVYVFQFESHFWVVPSEGNRRAVAMLRDLAVECDEVTSEYRCILIEGPYSWSLAKEVFGFEVLGLSYQRFIEVEHGSAPVVMARLSTTGEYGFRIYAAPDQEESILEALRSNGVVEFAEASFADFKTLQRIAATEMRSSIFEVTVPSGTNLAEHELRWMIDHTNSRVATTIAEPTMRVVGFKVEGGQPEESIPEGCRLLLDGVEVATVRYTLYSPVLGCQIGYAAFESGFGFAGLVGLSVEGRPELTVSTHSTPFFLPVSSKVQMQ